ncbi:MAG: hypothetical protein R3D25_03380 [Geminicoccaceae bacterium]
MTTSPTWPAAAAGLSGVTWATSAPGVFEAEALGDLRVTAWICTPSQPRLTKPAP